MHSESELEQALRMMGTCFSSYGKNRAVKCPLSPWTHMRGRDKHASLMIISKEPIAVFKCWACLEQGTVVSLAKKYGQYSGDFRALDYLTALGKPVWGDRKLLKRKFGDPFVTKKEEVFRLTEQELSEKYLQEIPTELYKRGVSQEQIDRWQLGYDPKEKRIIFPVRAYEKKRLVGISGRDLTGTQTKYKNYPGFQKSLYFYGECFYHPETRRIGLCEGQFDTLTLERYGFKNIFGTFGTSLSWEQMKKLKDWGDEILFFPDGNDDGQGLRFAEESCVRILGEINKRVKIAGVRVNPFYVYRSQVPSRWEKCDFRFEILDNFIGKDPGTWDLEDIGIAFENVGEMSLQGGISVKVERVEMGLYQAATAVEEDLSDLFK